MLKKFPLDKISVTQNVLFFLSQAPVLYSFTFNSQFLFKMNPKVYLSTTVCGIFHFWFCLTFIKVCFFCSKKVWTFWLQDNITPFKIRMIEKPHTVLLVDLQFLSCNKKFKNSMKMLCKTGLEINLLNSEDQRFEYFTFSK